MRLVGAHEVRELLGVSRQRVYQLAAKSGFPRPVATLAQGKIWLLGDIERWLAGRGMFDKELGKSIGEQVRDLNADFAGTDRSG